MRRCLEAPITLGRSDGWRRTLVYGLAHYGKSLFWYAAELLLAFYLTELGGLSPSAMGVVLATGLAASAAMDVLLGARLGRFMPDAEAAGRLQLVGAILCAVAFSAVFVGAWMPDAFRFAYALAVGLAFRFAYVVYDVPQNALMTLATAESGARNRVAATRIWFSGLATLTVSAAVGPMLAARGGRDLVVCLGLAVAGSVLAVATAAGLRVVIRRATDQKAGAHAPAETPGLRPSRGLWLMMALMAVSSLATPLFSKIEPFFAAYVLKSPVLGGVLAASMAIGIAAGQPLLMQLSRRFEMPVVLALAAGTQLVGLAMIGLAGVETSVLIAAAVLFGIGNGGVGKALWGGFSEVAATEARGQEGLAFGLFSGVAKICLALGALALGLVLARLDYRQDESAILTWLLAGLPGAGALAILGIAWAWERARRTVSAQAVSA